MQDLVTLESKSIEELREIAKAFGIASEKLSKRTLIKLISGGAEPEASETRVPGMCAGCLHVSIKPVLELFLVLSLEPIPLFIRDRNKGDYL